jgi:hypothetical protein
MKKQVIRLTESELYDIINESVIKIINEASNLQLKRKLIRKLYKETQELTSHIYRDDDWRHVSDSFAFIRDIIGDIGELSVRVENGGYVKDKDGIPMYKEYLFNIVLNDNSEINGSLKCHAAGSVEDPFDRYDITITMW